MKNGVFCCSDVRALSNEEQRELLLSQGVRSVLQCVILDDGHTVGFVGFDDCWEPRIWTAKQIGVLTMISQILSIFLIKTRVKTRLEQTVAQMNEILENQDRWIYVVDPESHRLMYANRKTKDDIPDVAPGQICHRAFFGRTEPCEVCPMRLALMGGTGAVEIYHPLIDVRISASAAKISWNQKPAVLITCGDVTRYQKEAALPESNR